MKVTIISVGKKNDAALSAQIDDYTSRLSRAISIEWRILPPSKLSDNDARLKESGSILLELKPNDVVWLLDERGEQITSPGLAGKLEVLKLHGVSRLVIIIGGAYGVSDTLRDRATWQWSLGKLVFPHQIVRLILAEQLYRATEIARGSGYHHA